MGESIRSQPIWEIDTSHPELVEPLTTELRTVIDPELGLNVIELGLIRNVTITDGQAVISMIMTTPFCPYAPAMLEMTRNKGEAALRMPTAMSLGFEPWDPSMMEDGAAPDWGFF